MRPVVAPSRKLVQRLTPVNTPGDIGVWGIGGQGWAPENNKGGIPMKTAITTAVLAATMLASCAQRANEVQATYVSPMTYQGYSCKQIEVEARRVANRAGQIAGVQEQNANRDAAATAAAVILFWPAAFFVRGDGTNAAELARLRGELEALEVASNEKNCGLTFETREAPAG